MSGKAGRGADQFMVRLPTGMRDRIKAAADANNRSMNAEVVATLEEKYPVPTPDEELSLLINTFEALPVEVRNRFILDYVQQNFSPEDIADGLVPGVALRKE